MRRITAFKGVLTQEIYDRETGRFETAIVPFTDFPPMSCAAETPPSEALSLELPAGEIVMAQKPRRSAARRLLPAADNAALAAPTREHWWRGAENSESSPILVTR